MNLMHDLHIPVTIRPAYHPTSYPDILQDEFSFLVLNRPQTDASSYRVWHLCFNYCQALHAFCCLCAIGAREAAPPLFRQLGWQAGIRQVLVANELYRCIIFAFKKLSLCHMLR